MLCNRFDLYVLLVTMITLTPYTTIANNVRQNGDIYEDANQ